MKLSDKYIRRGTLLNGGVLYQEGDKPIYYVEIIKNGEPTYEGSFFYVEDSYSDLNKGVVVKMSSTGDKFMMREDGTLEPYFDVKRKPYDGVGPAFVEKFGFSSKYYYMEEDGTCTKVLGGSRYSYGWGTVVEMIKNPGVQLGYISRHYYRDVKGKLYGPFAEAEPYNDEPFAVVDVKKKEKSKWCYRDIEGNISQPFDSVKAYHCGHAICELDEMFYIRDAEGKLSEKAYDSISFDKDKGCFYCCRNSENREEVEDDWTVCDLLGRETAQPTESGKAFYEWYKDCKHQPAEIVCRKIKWLKTAYFEDPAFVKGIFETYKTWKKEQIRVARTQDLGFDTAKLEIELSLVKEAVEEKEKEALKIKKAREEEAAAKKAEAERIERERIAKEEAERSEQDEKDRIAKEKERVEKEKRDKQIEDAEDIIGKF